MNIADLTTARSEADILASEMTELGRRAKAAAQALAIAPTEQKNAALRAMAAAIRANAEHILESNRADLGDATGVAGSFLDRLTLTPARVEAMAVGLDEIAALADPVGTIIAEWDRPNGLHIERVRTPLGVIGVIYESRPNVTADAGGLSVKAGNAAILRGGTDSRRSSAAIAVCLARGLAAADLPETAIQLVPSQDRAAVGMMLRGLSGTIDVIVPRGGRSLVSRVQIEAQVPVFAHLDGVNHVYVHAAADLAMARAVVVNAKMRRTGICGAAETLLVDRAVADTHLHPLVTALREAGCEIRGDAEVRHRIEDVVPATEEDWSTEYLDAIISVKLVDGVDEAVSHISTYGSRHTDAIITADQPAADRFLERVDSAIVLHNASTQFADGGEFGMGAEIGIATGKLHARGPIGVEQLTTFKYRVRGAGQVRP